MTPDKNFKLSKSSKTMMALMPGTQEDRNSFKKAMIDAELREAHARLMARKSKDHKKDSDTDK